MAFAPDGGGRRNQEWRRAARAPCSQLPQGFENLIDRACLQDKVDSPIQPMGIVAAHDHSAGGLVCRAESLLEQAQQNLALALDFPFQLAFELALQFAFELTLELTLELAFELRS